MEFSRLPHIHPAPISLTAFAYPAANTCIAAVVFISSKGVIVMIYKKCNERGKTTRFDAKLNTRKGARAVWIPAPRDKAPVDMIYCKVIMQHIKHCGSFNHCKVRGCKARREART